MWSAHAAVEGAGGCSARQPRHSRRLRCRQEGGADGCRQELGSRAHRYSAVSVSRVTSLTMAIELASGGSHRLHGGGHERGPSAATVRRRRGDSSRRGARVPPDGAQQVEAQMFSIPPRSCGTARREAARGAILKYRCACNSMAKVRRRAESQRRTLAPDEMRRSGAVVAPRGGVHSTKREGASRSAWTRQLLAHEREVNEGSGPGLTMVGQSPLEERAAAIPSPSMATPKARPLTISYAFSRPRQLRLPPRPRKSVAEGAANRHRRSARSGSRFALSRPRVVVRRAVSRYGGDQVQARPVAVGRASGRAHHNGRPIDVGANTSRRRSDPPSRCRAAVLQCTVRPRRPAVALVRTWIPRYGSRSSAAGRQAGGRAVGAGRRRR